MSTAGLQVLGEVFHGMGPCAACPLRGHTAFQACSEIEQSIIQDLKRQERDFLAGEMLIVEGAPESGLYTLLEGWAIRFKTLPDQRRQILSILLPGDFVGLQQKLDRINTHGVQALTAGLACRFARDAVWTLHRELPSLGYDLTWLAADSNNVVDDNLLSVGRRNASERLCALLLTLQARLMRLHEQPAGEPMPFPLTQQHLADALGLSLIHLHRTWRVLMQRGWIEVPGPGTLRLSDATQMAAHAHLRWPMQLAKLPLI